MQVGFWKTYDVEEIDLDIIAGKNDTTKYQLRELYQSTYIDTAGNTVYRVERYRNDDSIWVLQDVVRELTSLTTFDRIVDNQRQVKIVYPLVRNMEWDGNRYLHIDSNNYYFENWSYQIEYFDQSGTVNSLSFDSTLFVNHIRIHDVHIYRDANEIYAKDIGLIYKKIAYFDSQNASNLSWNEKAETGFSIEMKINSYKGQ